jgi:broad specificity phosphatase PhoE
VENPKGVIYGRLPGFNLSERGRKQAAKAAEHLAGRDISTVWSSPLERAQETAAVIAQLHGIEVRTDPRLIESATTLEGLGRTAGAFLRSPLHWWSLRNPWRPSWGESFSQIRARVVDAIGEAMESSGGGEVVIVSHQTPVQAARLALAHRNLPPWLGTACSTGSVSTLVLDQGRVVSSEYFVPVV